MKDQKKVLEYSKKFENSYKDKDPKTSDEVWTKIMASKRRKFRLQVKAFATLVDDAIDIDLFIPGIIEKNNNILQSNFSDVLDDNQATVNAGIILYHNVLTYNLPNCRRNPYAATYAVCVATDPIERGANALCA